MPWKGTMRSFGAAAHRIRREHQREQPGEQPQHLALPMLAPDAPQREVDERVELLSCIASECYARFDWLAVQREPAPIVPVRQTARSLAAGEALRNYVPTWLERTFGGEARRRAQLETELRDAEAGEERAFKKASLQHQVLMTEWESMQHLASGILSGDAEAVLEAIQAFDLLNAVEGLGVRLHVQTDGRHQLEATLVVNGEVAVPPGERSRDLYKRYVVGCVLRLGRELLGIIPVDAVIVHARRDVEPETIVSAVLPRDSLRTIDFAAPLDVLASLRHAMNFSASDGFRPVDKL